MGSLISVTNTRPWGLIGPMSPAEVAKPYRWRLNNLSPLWTILYCTDEISVTLLNSKALSASGEGILDLQPGDLSTPSPWSCNNLTQGSEGKEDEVSLSTWCTVTPHPRDVSSHSSVSQQCPKGFKKLLTKLIKTTISEHWPSKTEPVSFQKLYLSQHL